jgi:hypothetical protein
VEKYGTASQVTDDNIIRRMRFACWITKATDTRSECIILIRFCVVTIVTRQRHNVTFIRILPVLMCCFSEVLPTSVFLTAVLICPPEDRLLLRERGSKNPNEIISYSVTRTTVVDRTIRSAYVHGRHVLCYQLNFPNGSLEWPMNRGRLHSLVFINKYPIQGGYLSKTHTSVHCRDLWFTFDPEGGLRTHGIVSY